ncbi:MAG: ABC transporter family substrate-binding protein [Actinomycetota bacterium]|nr:ABC transporter family substrate-binding protein [Actinomycetota bacterium]
MRLPTRGTALLSAALAATVALGACKSSSEGGGGGTNGGAGAGTDLNDVTPTPYVHVRDGGMLRWPIDSFPANFNVDEVEGNERNVTDLMFSTLPTVWYFDSRSKPVLNTELVDRTEQTSTDPQVITYHINPKAMWSDGAPITWLDFKAQVSALSGRDKAFKIASSTGYEQVGSVERGATDRDVKLTFTTKFPDWRSLFTPLTPASLNADANAFNTSWISGPTVSGGPFKVDKIDKVDETITVVRNEKWWGQRPKLDRIEFVVLDQGATAKAFRAGQVDLVDIDSDAAALATVRTVAGATVHKAVGPDWRQIDLGARGPMADVKVRQAVMLAIDREGDAKAQLTPLSGPASLLDSHFWMTSQAQYKSTCEAFCKRNVVLAGTLLESAGFTRGADGIYAKNGRPFAVEFLIPSGVTRSESEARLQETALRAAGIKVIVKTVPADRFLPDYVLTGQFDLTIFSWIGTQFPISFARSVYFSNGDRNYARIGTAEIDALFDQAPTQLNRAKATELTHQIDRKIWEEGHSVALYQEPELVATRSGLVNFGAFGFAGGASPRNYVPIGFKG